MVAKKVLLAEDYDLLRKAYALTITDIIDSVKIDEVGTCKELLEKASSGKYDLIITDYEMEQGTNGIDAIKKIRAFDKETPICMISFSRVSKEALKNGATDYIGKGTTTSLQDLKNVIIKYLLS
jgi:CheY-like chemotaxis protein